MLSTSLRLVAVSPALRKQRSRADLLSQAFPAWRWAAAALFPALALVGTQSRMNPTIYISVSRLAAAEGGFLYNLSANTVITSITCVLTNTTAALQTIGFDAPAGSHGGDVGATGAPAAVPGGSAVRGGRHAEAVPHGR